MIKYNLENTDIERLDTHAASASVHFTEASIDHGNILGLEDDDHPQYMTDTIYNAHAASASVHFTEASIDHGSIAGLGDDDHPQYMTDTIYNAHAASASVHFTEGSITHDNLNAVDSGTYRHLSAAQVTDLTDGGDTTLHDHDGISENTGARHTQGTDTALGTMAADIDMDNTYQVVNLQAPAAAGEALRQTVNITEADLEQLTDGSDTTLHDHDGISENSAARHAESHNVASHSDTSATGAELNTLTDNSVANTLHRHSELVASDGAPDPAFSINATGYATFPAGTGINEFSIDGTLTGNSDTAVPTEKAVKAYADTKSALAHAARHTDGNDDIQSATNAQKGVATAAQITALEANVSKLGGIETAAEVSRYITTGDANGTGWRRVAYLDFASGRGSQQISVYVEGGSWTPTLTTVIWSHDWTAGASISVLHDSNALLWDAVRVTNDSVSGDSFLEFNFTNDVDVLFIELKKTGVHSGGIYSGDLPAGGDDVEFTMTLDGNPDVTGANTAADSLLLNGKVQATAKTGDTIVLRGGSGDIQVNHVHCTPGDIDGTVTKVCLEEDNDGYIKHGSAAQLLTFIGVAAGADVTAANQAESLLTPDVRATNEDPSFYYAKQKGLYTEFKQRATIGAPGSFTYGFVTISVPWADASGGKVVQYYCEGVNASKRYSVDADNWGSWTTVEDGADVTGSNAPQAHKASHQNGGGDEVSVVGLSGLLADDQHVLDAEVKLIKLDDFATPDDNTDLNASTSRHGLLKKLDNVATNFLNGQGNWAEPAGGGGVEIYYGTYTGNSGSLSITGVGFQPRFVMTAGQSLAGGGWIKMVNMSGTWAMYLNNGSYYNNRILSLDADGFSLLGTSGDPNISGRQYTYMCIN